MITSHKINANGIGKENYDISTELTTMLVPIGLVASYKETLTEYQNQRRKDPNYVDALYDAVVLNDVLHMFANEEEEIDEATWEIYFFNLDELVAAFKNEPCLPKALVTKLLQGYADVVATCAFDRSTDSISDYSFQNFRWAYQQRLCDLLGCDDEMLVTRLD